MNRPLAVMLRALDDEIEALKLLRYRHQVCALLLASGDPRYLAMATDELEMAEEKVAERDLVRAMATDELAEYWDVTVSPVTLEDILHRASDQEALQLTDRRGLLRTAVQELEQLRSVTTSLASNSLMQIQGRVIELGDHAIKAPLTYDGNPRVGTTTMQYLG